MSSESILPEAIRAGVLPRGIRKSSGREKARLPLLLSLWIGTSNAITLVYGLWLARYLLPASFFNVPQYPLLWFDFLSAYQHFWQSPLLLLSLSVILIGTSLLWIMRSDHMLSQKLAL